MNRYVVDFEPGIFGPFDNREQADAWAIEYAAEMEEPIVSWSVKTLHNPDGPA